MLKRDNWTIEEAEDILLGNTIAYTKRNGVAIDDPEFYRNMDRNKGIYKVINDVKTSEKSIWTNDEIIDHIDNNQFKMDDSWTKEEWDSKGRWNQGLEQCAIQFGSFKEDPEESYSAMAYDVLTKRIYVISPPLPQ
jgi:hypothetical protein